MTPVLYDAGEKDFGRGGIGQLTDALSCVVTEERNGAYELMLEYPVDGALYSYIGEGCIIKAKPNDTAAPQLFRIYRSTKPINMRVTYYAEHISYLLGGMPVERVEVAGATAQTAMRRILESCIVENDFEAESDIELTSSLSLSLVSARAALGGVEGSVLDVYGGEYEFDNYKIKLHAHRGRDTGVIVAYGKNLTDFAQDKNIAEMYTGVLPFARYTITNEDGSEGGDVTVTIPELTLTSPNAGAMPYPRILIKDFSSAFDGSGEITPEMLLSKAQSWASTSGYDAPKVNITVAFQNLWQSPEYAEFAELEKVSLCDTVTVSFERLGITAKAKVIKTVYDVLRERYSSVELGDAKANFADTVSGFGGDLTALETRMRERVRGVGERVAETNRAIKKFSEALSNASGLYHTEEVQPDGSTIYYLHDKPLLADSMTVIEITNAAIFFSRDGGKSYPYAIGYDGEALLEKIYAVGINADYIKTGRIEVTDDAGEVIFSVDMDTHEVTINAESVHIGSKNVRQAIDDASEDAKKHADEAAGAAAQAAQTAQSTADGAATAAGNAQSTADNAAKAAQTAQETAETAVNVSASAVEIASSLGDQVDTLESELRVQAGEIDAKVSEVSGEVASSFGWSLKADGWSLYADGEEVLTADRYGLSVTGEIMTGSGKIAGWDIKETYIGNSQRGGSIYIASASDASDYWIRAHDSANGGGSVLFGVRKDGSLYARSADIEGTATITSGNVGGWDITENAIYKSDGDVGAYLTYPGSGYGGKVSPLIGEVCFAIEENWGTVFAVTNSGDVLTSFVRTQGVYYYPNEDITGTSECGSITFNDSRYGNRLALNVDGDSVSLGDGSFSPMDDSWSKCTVDLGTRDCPWANLYVGDIYATNIYADNLPTGGSGSVETGSVTVYANDHEYVRFDNAPTYVIIDDAYTHGGSSTGYGGYGARVIANRGRTGYIWYQDGTHCVYGSLSGTTLTITYNDSGTSGSIEVHYIAFFN